jgi:WD40 repeat protein
VETLKGHSGQVGDVAFSPDRRRLASAGTDGRVKLWDLSHINSPAIIRGNVVIFSPSGEALVTTSRDGSVRIWNAATGEEQMGFESPQGGGVLALSADQQWLATGKPDGTVLVRDLETQQLYELPGRHGYSVDHMLFSPDGKLLASMAGGDDVESRQLKLWNPGTSELLADVDVRQGVHDRSAYAIAFSPDGKYFAAVHTDLAQNDVVLNLWHLRAGVTAKIGQPITLDRQRNVPILSVVFSGDGQHIATGSWDGTIKLWNVTRREQTLELVRAHVDRVYCLAFSPDNTRLASGGQDRSVKLWDVGTGDEVGSLTGHEVGVLSVAFAPDGRTLASSGDDGQVIIWRAAPETE